MCVNSSCGCGRNTNCGCNNNCGCNGVSAFNNNGCNSCNCNRCSFCDFLNTLLYGSNRSGCGCHNHGCGCNNNWRGGCNSCGCNSCANNNNCGCFDAYYARQYGLNMGCCGRNDWFSCQTRSTCCCSNNVNTVL